jgi:CheY-like chemotaxis protein
LLKDAGYEIMVASNGQEATEIVQRERPGLVSLDMSMPEKSGVKFYREMRDDAELAKIPIVIVTGVSTPWVSPDGTGSFQRFISKRRQVPPPDGFFEKPIDPDAFLKKIADLLRQS